MKKEKMSPIPPSKISDRVRQWKYIKGKCRPHSLQKAPWAAHSGLLNSWILTGYFLSEVNDTSAIYTDPTGPERWPSRLLPPSKEFIAALIDSQNPTTASPLPLFSPPLAANFAHWTELLLSQSVEVLFAELRYVLQQFGPIHLTKQSP